MIRAVTVDWWNTLAAPPEDWEPFSKRTRIEGIREVLRAHGIACTLARLDIAYDLWTEHLARRWRQNTDLPGEEQIADLLASAGYDRVVDSDAVGEIAEIIGRPLVDRPPTIHEGAIDTLRSLKARGIGLAIISNTGRTLGRFLRQVQEKVGMDGLFDHRAFSDEVRVRKPAPAIFDQTLAALEVAPDEAVHVGDDVDADVAGAKEFGMRAVWYDSATSPAADGSRADAVIHAWRELPEVLAKW
ncbi:MAG TPA: HAD family hydrolase [Thermoplasmata archaeon]|nr:HAD family hydrolase [Thermoplasmata archaeon]